MKTAIKHFIVALAIVFLPATFGIQPARARHLSAQSWTFTTLYTFTGGADGAYPYAGLARDAAGNLYGTAECAGSGSGCGTGGHGVVFSVDSSGNESTLYTFTGQQDGGLPLAGLILDEAGNLYGTTSVGGDLEGCSVGSGCGTVFMLDPQGNEHVLYAFTGKGDGAEPVAGLVRDTSGNLFGTASMGGDFKCQSQFGCGVVFAVDANGKERVLHAFAGGTDGTDPLAGLLPGSSGNLYGTTAHGGDASCSLDGTGCGTVFEIDRSGKETVLHSFKLGRDGGLPSAGLTPDEFARLSGFGTTQYGGNSTLCPPFGCGAVFVGNTSGGGKTRYSFTGLADGGGPYGGVVADSSGNLYGTTVGGGQAGCGMFGSGCGVVFEIDPSGNETVLHTFAGTADGGNPYAGLIRDSAGNLYGTTTYGGQDFGTVFMLAPGARR